jgi:ABC-2 type transport system ATP-binding protein
MAERDRSLAVDVRDLVKRYPKRDINAVDGLSFSVSPGEVFGLLGPNGAGKSTTIGVLTTRIVATSGEVSVAGVDVLRHPVAARARFAVVPQQVNLDRALTPRQNLTFHAAYHGFGREERAARAVELLEEFGLAADADVKVDWYSGGMAQRLMIARALMHEPSVLFLDEPTTGLDPHARLFVWERIRQLKERGTTTVLTTHDMEEAAELSDRVGIVDHGRLLALDTPEALTRGLSGRSVLDLTVTPPPGDAPDDVLAPLLAIDEVERAEAVVAAPNGAEGVRLRLYLTAAPATALGPVVRLLAGRAAALTNVHIGEPSLEDVFIELTGRGLR